MDHEYLEDLDRRKKEVLVRIRKAAEGRTKSELEYADALLTGRGLGLGFTVMGKAAGVSETAVRLYVKRHEAKK